MQRSHGSIDAVGWPTWRRTVAMCLACVIGFICPAGWPGQNARGQLPSTAAPQPDAADATAMGDLLDQAQLEQLLAPIALYPDVLLTQVMVAATYPLEVVQASRWLAQGQNATLQGDALAKALEAQPWDPSVKSMVPFPNVLRQMNDQLEWTQALGDAMLAQKQDVLNAVQVLRARAMAVGKLDSGPQQTVTTTQNIVAAPMTGGAKVSPPSQVIAIEPTQPTQVYVPAYDPGVVYGSWLAGLQFAQPAHRFVP